MFTGIVKELGVIRKLDKEGGARGLAVESAGISADVIIGDSVSVNGVCLTLVEKKKNILYFDIMAETVRRSALADLKNGDGVNLEDSLKADAKLGGHFVLGHIDCIGKIKEIKKAGGEHKMAIEFPREFAHLVVEKGSVAIDGVSLTVGDVTERSFDVYLVGHTLKTTNLGLKKSGDIVNIEFDVIGKYVTRFNELKSAKSSITEYFLKEKGF